MSLPTYVCLIQEWLYQRRQYIQSVFPLQCLADLKAGKQSNVPIYDFSLHKRIDETKYLYGPAVIIAEGIMALQDPALRSLYDVKVRQSTSVAIVQTLAYVLKMPFFSRS